MQGHVDGVGAVWDVREDGFARVVTVGAPPEIMRYVIEKGSIAVDGVSLTIAGLRRRLVPGLADPRDARTDDPRRGGHRDARQPGGGRARQVHRTTGADPMSFATIEEAIEDIRAGRMVVVCDDEDRENEGDLTMAAQFVTPEAINFMAKEGRGLICLALTPQRCDELGLDLMAAKNESPFETAFTVTIEARDGVTTGISAADRARTIQVAIDPELGAARPRPARPRLPAEGQARRRARAHGPDRGGGRPRAAGRV